MLKSKKGEENEEEEKVEVDTKTGVLLQLLFLRLQLRQARQIEESLKEKEMKKKWREVFEVEEEAFTLATQEAVNLEILKAHSHLMGLVGK